MTQYNISSFSQRIDFFYTSEIPTMHHDTGSILGLEVEMLKFHTINKRK